MLATPSIQEAAEAAIIDLVAARADGRAWHELGRLVVAAVDQGFTHPPWWQKAARQVGLSELMLQRYATAYRRLRGISDRHGRPLGDLLPSSFSGAELALRIHDADPAKGLDSLIEMRERRVTIDGLRKRLSELPRPASRSRAAAQKGRAGQVDFCETAIANAVPILWGEGVVSERRPVLRGFRKVGFEFRGPAGGLVGGADLVLHEPLRGGDPLSEISRSVLLSLYLPSFHLLMGPGHPEAVLSDAEAALTALDARWIGILSVTAAGQVDTVRRPEGRPAIDRTGSYAELRRALSTGR